MTRFAPRWPALALTLGGLLAGLAPAAESKPPQSALIDEKISEKWKANDLKAAPKANDLQFLRRAFLDLIGRVPTLEEVKHFEADVAPNKRGRLVSRLLRDKEYKIKVSPKETLTFYYAEEYARHWANVWDTWLMTRGGLDRMYHEQMENWLEKQFVDNTPYNELVEKLVTATGKTNENPAVNFVLSHMGEAVPANDKASQGNFDFVPLTSRVTRLFLGVQVQCTQCHDHPFNPEWTQENFWGVNSFLRQVNRSGTPLLATGNRKKMMATNIEVSDDVKLNESMRVFYERRSGVLMSIRPTMLADLEKKDTPKKVMSSAAAARPAGRCSATTWSTTTTSPGGREPLLGPDVRPRHERAGRRRRLRRPQQAGPPRVAGGAGRGVRQVPLRPQAVARVDLQLRRLPVGARRQRLERQGRVGPVLQPHGPEGDVA
jgi:hypothetical protein